MVWTGRNYGLGMDALVTVFSRNTNGIMVWHGRSGHRILVEHERNCGLGMDAPVTVFSWNGIMVWSWMLLVMFSTHDTEK